MCADRATLRSLGLGALVATLSLPWVAGDAAAADAPNSATTSPTRQLVFGSFTTKANAERFRIDLAAELQAPMTVQAIDLPEQRLHRVVSAVADATDLGALSSRATAADRNFWRAPVDAGRSVAATALGGGAVPRESGAATAGSVSLAATNNPSPVRSGVADSSTAAVATAAGLGVTVAARPVSRRTDQTLDAEVSLATRSFLRSSPNSGDQQQQSASLTLDYLREWDGGTSGVRGSLFGRYDSDDAQRKHVDLRELVYTYAGNDWQLEAGVGQVFWGVVEFNHLIDIVNQTDLVENPDGEDKLGQPMVALTLLRDWGTLELFALPGFRPRTLPGLNGRLTMALPIDRGAAVYESGAGRKRVDALVRYAHQIGPLAFDLYHFEGTRRSPNFLLGTADDAATPILIPSYDVIAQTAVSAQANVGDTALKLEALRQRGGPLRYSAVALGIEHTFVGFGGGRGDLGVVLEYFYDSRDRAAFDTFFENDIAVGARWFRNDLADSQALIGLIVDLDTGELLASLEGSRRLGDNWSMVVEARAFAGGQAVGRFDSLAAIFDPANKSGSFQRDDYVQLEFVRYF